MSKPHNPAGLTEAQYGRDQGYRLLEVDEIRDDGKIIDDIWCKEEGEWKFGYLGNAEGNTYRTKLTRSALAAARGLTPASEPENADVFDAWLTHAEVATYEKWLDSNLSFNDCLRAAFLAGQRSERNEIESALNKLSKDDVDAGGLGWIGSRELRDIAAWVASREPKGDQP